MSRSRLYILFILLSSVCAYAQAPALDSVKWHLADAASLKDSVGLLNELSDLYYFKPHKNRDSLRKYSAKGLELAKQHRLDSVFLTFSAYKAISFYYSDTAQYFKYMRLAEHKAVEMGAPAQAARYSYYQSARYENFDLSDKVLALATKSLSYLHQSDSLNEKDEILKSRIYKRTINAYRLKGQYKEALEQVLKLEALSYERDHLLSKLETYIAYIDIYTELLDEGPYDRDHPTYGAYKRKLKNAIDSLNILSADGETRHIQARHAYSEIYKANYLFDENKVDSALVHYRLATKLAEAGKFELVLYDALIGQLVVLIEQQDDEEIEKLLKGTIQVRNEIKTSNRTIELDQLLLQYYLQTDQKSKAAAVYKRLKPLWSEDKLDKSYLSAYKSMLAFEESTNQYKLGLKHHKAIVGLEDAMKVEDLVSQLEHIEGQYEVAKKNEEIALLKEREAVTKSRNIKRWFITVVITLALISLLLIGLLRYRNKRLLVERQYENLKQRLLRTQMNPHFTFNALSTIQSYIYENKLLKAGEFLASFSKLIRKNLEYTNLKSISLEEEMAFMNRYLSLEKERKQDLFDYEITSTSEIPPSAVRMQPIFVQPIVENSIKHGFKHMKSGGSIKINYAVDVDKRLLIASVLDNGCGYDVDQKRAKTSFGLNIVQERIDILKKTRKMPYHIDVKSSPDGTHTIIHLPFEYA